VFLNFSPRERAALVLQSHTWDFPTSCQCDALFNYLISMRTTYFSRKHWRDVLHHINIRIWCPYKFVSTNKHRTRIVMTCHFKLILCHHVFDRDEVNPLTHCPFSIIRNNIYFNFVVILNHTLIYSKIQKDLLHSIFTILTTLLTLLYMIVRGGWLRVPSSMCSILDFESSLWGRRYLLQHCVWSSNELV
jgi:hypothetical protein